MLVVIVSDHKEFRKEHLAGMCSAESDIIVLDETFMTLPDLEQYMYPSLFSSAVSVIHAQFMLEHKLADLTASLAKQLVASPTIFIFEELSLPTPAMTMLKKYGALVHTQAAQKSVKKVPDLFHMASAIITTNKKDAWMNFQAALLVQPVEALLGIMYWKVRDSMLKQPGRKGEYKTLYENLLRAHAKAWQTNTPLELMIEKVLLQ